jgi:hypothetical protein
LVRFLRAVKFLAVILHFSLGMGDLLLHDSIAFLKKSGTNGKSLYDHLSDVIVKILEQKPDNAYSVFENVSLCFSNISPF